MIFCIVRFGRLMGRMAGLPCTVGVLRIWLLGELICFRFCEDCVGNRGVHALKYGRWYGRGPRRGVVLVGF